MWFSLRSKSTKALFTKHFSLPTSVTENKGNSCSIFVHLRLQLFFPPSRCTVQDVVTIKISLLHHVYVFLGFFFY